MLDPWCRTNPSAYQPRQALIAIISGGWFGKGPGRGILKFGFLPEDSTDFIFAAFCEEWGFVGAMLLMALVTMWIWFAWRSAMHAGDKFGRTLAGSLGFLIAVQAVMHITVNVSKMPPTGVSLPFVSAGGTSLVILAGAAALIASVAARRRPDGLSL
jgi:cell division protein FtsW